MKRAILLYTAIAWIALLAPMVGAGTGQSPSQDASTIPATPVQDKPQPLLTDGTAVRLRPLSDITSKHSKRGEELHFHVASDVIVENLVVIRRGASAIGHVRSVKKSGHMGRAGNFTIEINSVETITGAVIPLQSTHSKHGEGRQGDIIGATAQTMGLGAPVFLLFKGENVKIPAGAAIIAYVKGDVPFDMARVKELQPPPAPVTGLATVYLLRGQERGTKAPPIYCGATEIAKLRAKHFLEVQLSPGEYPFHSPDIASEVYLRVEPDQTYYIFFAPNGFLAPGHLGLIDPAEADDLLAFPGWQADPKVDLSKVDPARLRDIPPPPKPVEESPPPS
jgi:hypothetical protein